MRVYMIITDEEQREHILEDFMVRPSAEVSEDEAAAMVKAVISQHFKVIER